MIQAAMDKLPVLNTHTNTSDSFFDDPAAIIESFYQRIDRLKNKISGLVLARGYSNQKDVWRQVGYHVISKFGRIGRKHDNDIETLKKVELHLKDLFLDLKDGNNLEAFVKTL